MRGRGGSGSGVGSSGGGASQPSGWRYQEGLAEETDQVGTQGSSTVPLEKYLHKLSEHRAIICFTL